MEINWNWSEFNALQLSELYELLMLRQQVFMLEQNSLYLDLDGVDSRCWHLRGTTSNGTLAAYLRLIPPAEGDSSVHLGRIVVAADCRGERLGRELIARGLRRCRSDWPDRPIAISAQQYLVPLYQEYGFRTLGEPYDDGGVLHIDMVLAPG